MEKAISKLKFEIETLKGLHSPIKRINEQIISYEKAVKVLENFQAGKLIKIKK